MYKLSISFRGMEQLVQRYLDRPSIISWYVLTFYAKQGQDFSDSVKITSLFKKYIYEQNLDFKFKSDISVYFIKNIIKKFKFVFSVYLEKYISL